MELQLSGRSVIPSSLAKRLMEHFSDGAGVRERVWEREQGEILAEGMVHSLYYTRMIMDMHGAIPQVTPYFENGAFKEIYKEETRINLCNCKQDNQLFRAVHGFCKFRVFHKIIHFLEHFPAIQKIADIMQMKFCPETFPVRQHKFCFRQNFPTLIRK